jgi:hypothetical protein
MPACAADVIADWPTIAMPPPPTLKPATVDPKTTALFLFDFMSTNCGERPRCVEAVPKLKALHDRARAVNMLVAYTMPGDGKIIDPSIAPREGEVVDQRPGGPDKFLGDDPRSAIEDPRDKDRDSLRHLRSGCRYRNRVGRGSTRLRCGLSG